MFTESTFDPFADDTLYQTEEERTQEQAYWRTQDAREGSAAYVVRLAQAMDPTPEVEIPFPQFLREECGNGSREADELDRLVAALERDAGRWRGTLPQLASDLAMVAGRAGREAESLRAAA